MGTSQARIAMVEDLQSAWLLLVCCAPARANFFLRSVSPGQISTFASHHDDQMWACLCTLLGRIGATLPLRLGGLGLRSAVRLRYAAHWASWADCIRMVYQRHPIVPRTIIEAVEANDPAQTAQGVVSSIDSLRTAGFVITSWDDLIREGPNQGSVEEEDPSQPRFGRQKDAAVAVHKVFLEGELRPQGGPLASVPFTSLPTLRETTFAPQPFRLLLLRRSRLCIPLSARWCRCGRPLDCRGHHRSACSRESWAAVVTRWSP